MVDANHGSFSTLHISASASVICGARRVGALPSWAMARTYLPAPGMLRRWRWS